MSAPDVLERIIHQATMGPDHPAVADLDRSLTYAELVHEVARVAGGLRAAGVVEGDRVAVLLPNSVNFVVTAFASLWLGASFVPFAVSDPDTRLLTIADDCAPALIVTARDDDGTYAHPTLLDHVNNRDLDELRASDEVPVEPHDGARVAYAIYTSGTTGTPKGVLIDRAAFAAAVRSASEAMGLTSATRALCVSPFHFDGSYGTLFATLYVGGAVIMRPRDSMLFPRNFFKALTSEHITYTGFSPSYLRLLLASPQIAQLPESDLEVIALGGEACSVADVRALQAIAPMVRLFNRYGPTETTIAVTHAHLTPKLVANGVAPIGVPHPGVTFYLVDEDGAVIGESNRIGELYIGGSQLMVGYWNAPELTRTVLRGDVIPNETVYRTGDLAYRDDEGNYCYGGRIDNVVKRSGVRLSLLEISESIRAVDHVTAAACLTFDHDGELGIVAFVVVDREMSPLDLQAATRERLPESMMPNRFEVVTTLPLTRSNKLDERLLLAEAGLKPH